MLNVAPPSAGKTEAVNLLDDITDGRLNEITSAGRSAGHEGKRPHPVGILARVGGRHWSPSATCPACSPLAIAVAATKFSGCSAAPTTVM